MTASLSGVYNLQVLTSTGAPAASYRLYTLAQGTTTHKAAYTDAAATVPHTYTSDGAGGLYIALNARGELPAPLFLAAGPYDLTLKDSSGASVWTRYARGQDDRGDNLASDLASAASASVGAGMVGALWSLNYAARTVGNDLRYGTRPSIFRVLSAAQQADVLARTFTLDLTATINTALALCREWYFPSGGYLLAGTVTLAQDRQILSGDGFGTEFKYTGAGVAIDFDGRPGCSIDSVLLYATGGTTGIKIAPNAGRTRFPHWWRLTRVMVIGNTPNWATTSLAASRSGFSTAGVQVVTAFYGTAEHSETAYCTGNGWHLLDQANGNSFMGCHSRDSAVGLKIEGTGGGNSNGNSWVAGNIEASIAGSVGISLGEADRNRFSGRMEVSAAGGTHVVVNPPVGTLAQENQFDLELTGSSAGYALGDGSGSSQIKGTRIGGGKFGSSITISSDCLNTVVAGSPTGFSGVTITDNGYGTILNADVSNGTWYERPSAANTTATQHELLVGVGSVRESMGDNTRTMSFTGSADLFQWKKVTAGADVLAVMLFGSYRLWVSPVNGKLYIKGSDPTTHSDGTVVGTQT